MRPEQLNQWLASMESALETSTLTQIEFKSAPMVFSMLAGLTFDPTTNFRLLCIADSLSALTVSDLPVSRPKVDVVLPSEET